MGNYATTQLQTEQLHELQDINTNLEIINTNISFCSKLLLTILFVYCVNLLLSFIRHIY